METARTNVSRVLRWALVSLAGFAVFSGAVARGALPAPRGFVNDFAGVIDEPREVEIDRLLRRVARDTTAEIAVVTVPSLEGMTVEQYAGELFRAWGIGKKQTNNGALVLVAPADRAMRIEVGYGLEPVLPDGLAGEIIRTEFLPRIREGDYSGGIRDGVVRVAAIVREGKRAARGVVTRTEQPNDAPPAWLLVPFLGLFVSVGAFMGGAGVRARTRILLIAGAVITSIPFTMLLVTYPWLSLLTVIPVAAVVGTLGYAKAGARSWREQVRGASEVDSTDWISGSSSGSSTSSHSSSSSDFSGGSSGGGGASGHW